MEKSGSPGPNLENLRSHRQLWGGATAVFSGIVLAFFAAAACVPDLAAREKDALQYGVGLIVNVPFSEAEVSQVVQEIVQNGIIRGTREYGKDEYISGAETAASTRVFAAWTEGGKVFYKIRFHALDPQNFKNSGDVGTLAVRYVVQAQDEKHTVLRIDARFVEDYRHAAHPSNGSVEGAEYKDIHDHLESLALMKTQAADSGKSKQEFSSSKPDSTESQVVLKDVPTTPPVTPLASPKTIQLPPEPASALESTSTPSLEQRVHDLRQQVERIVKAPGAPLKAAPFHTASTLEPLAAGAEVLIVISTPYWYGVETHDGKHGWILREQLEMLP
ncbi:MAG TPA: hypothetical protein VMG82_06115 [Candidatus Sulfotelmatobacter sp.]|nr:hypothetical protein [Candidatus Sulfotelmatobacter sp.]